MEILDNSRRWWRARNIDLEVAFVPHTIVAPMQNYQSLDELLIDNCNIEESSNEQGPLVNENNNMSIADCQQPKQVRDNPIQNRNLNKLPCQQLQQHQVNNQLQHYQNPSQLRIQQQTHISNFEPPQQHNQRKLVRNSASGPFRYF